MFEELGEPHRTRTGVPNEGDILKGEAFRYGEREGKFVRVNGKPGKRADYIYRGDGRRARTVNKTAHDKSRGEAKFVVEEVFTSLREEDFPSWVVSARRLHPDGSYNPDGERIVFGMELPHLGSGDLSKDDFQVVGKMRRMYVRVPDAT